MNYLQFYVMERLSKQISTNWIDEKIGKSFQVALQYSIILISDFHCGSEIHAQNSTPYSVCYKI